MSATAAAATAVSSATTAAPTAASSVSSANPVETPGNTLSGEDSEGSEGSKDSEDSEDEPMAEGGLSSRRRFVKHDELLQRVIPLLQRLGVRVVYTTYKQGGEMKTAPTRLVFSNGEETSLFEQGTTGWHGQRREKETQWTGSQPSSLYFLAFNDIFPHQLTEELANRSGLENPFGAWCPPRTLRGNLLVYETIIKKVDKEPTRPLEVRHNACSLYNFAAGHKGEDETILLFLDKNPHTTIAEAHLMLSPYSLDPSDTRRQGVSPDGLMVAFYNLEDGQRVPITVSVEIKYRAGCGSSGCKTRRKKLAQEMLQLAKRNKRAPLKLAKTDIVGDIQCLFDAQDGLARWTDAVICDNPKHKPPHDHPCEYYAGQCQLHMFKQGTGVCLNAYGGMLKDGQTPSQRGFVMVFHMPSICSVALAMHVYVSFKKYLLQTGQGMDYHGEEYMQTLVASEEYHNRIARLHQLCDLMRRVCHHGLLGANKGFAQVALSNLFENLDRVSQSIVRKAGSFGQMMSKLMPDGATPCTEFTKQDVFEALANAYTHDRTERVLDFTAPRTQNMMFLYPLTLSEFQQRYQEYKDKYRALVGETTDGRDESSSAKGDNRDSSDDSDQEGDGPEPPRALLTILCEGRGVMTERFKLLKSVHACLKPGWGRGGHADMGKTAFLFDTHSLEPAPRPFHKKNLHMNLDNSIALPLAHDIPVGSYVRFVVDILYHAKADIWYTVVRSIILCQDQEDNGGDPDDEPDLLLGDVIPHPHHKPWNFKYQIVKTKYRSLVTTPNLPVGCLR